MTGSDGFHMDLRVRLFWDLWNRSPDNMFILRVDQDDYYVVTTNQAQQDTVETGENDLNGLALRTVLPPDFYQFVTPNYDRCVSSKAAVQYEEEEDFTSGGKETLYWSTMLSPVFNDASEVAYIFGISRNITELKRTQAAAEKAAEEAERANQVKTAFLANMSHEMRTPLNGIHTSAELLSDLCSTDEQKELCHIISRSSESLTRLTGDILEFAKIDAGKLRLENHNFSLSTLCNDIVQLLKPRADEKNIAFAVVLKEELPDHLYGDSGRLRQVLLNLASNGIKFTDNGSVTITISAPRKTDEQIMLEFSIVDTGIGIEQADIDKLFKPFSQVDDSTTRHYGGTGLGLAICKYLLEKMGGSIGLSSEPGRGSWFTCLIPFKYQKLKHSAVTSSAAVRDVTLEGRHVLLVEDNVTNQLVMGKLLGVEGLRVTIAENGQKALELCQQATFDLILMDWHMPVMDGLAATRAIRLLTHENASVPIIGLTANVMTEDREACLQAGMDEVVTKPVDRVHLRQEMLNQLERGEKLRT